jgi:tetratricopeptide (TPR) repeat protein
MGKKLFLSLSAFLSITSAAFGASIGAPVATTPNDPTLKYFSQAVDAVIAGDKVTLRKLYDYDVLDGITNHESVSKALNDLLKRVHQESRSLYRKGEVTKAADRLELAFDFTAYVADKLSHDRNTPDRTPEYWLFGWKSPSIKMAQNVYVSALNDYGFFLQRIDQNAEAVRILQAVISAEPDRELAYLNLANALWHLGRKDEALPYFEKYKEMRVEERKESINTDAPTQAILHISSSICPRKNTATNEPKAKVDLGPYLVGIQKEIKAHWLPPKGDNSQTTVLQFDIDNSGRISNTSTIKSTSEQYKQAAIKSLKRSSLPPLPAEAPNVIALEFTYNYNVLHSLDKEDLVIKQWMTRLAQNRTAENHAGLAEAYEDDGDFVRAREQLLLALERAPKNQRYEELLRENEIQTAEVKRQVNELGKDAPKTNPRLGVPQAALNNQGVNALNSGDYSLAIEKLSQALDIDPGYKLARNNLGIVFNNRGIRGRNDKVRALMDFHRALLLGSDDTAAEKNISTSIKSQIKGRDSYSLRRDLADRLAAKHDYVGAIAEYRRALQIKDDAKIKEPLQQILDRVMSPSYNDASVITDPK